MDFERSPKIWGGHHDEKCLLKYALASPGDQELFSYMSVC